jgi:hypothetical protein
MRVNEITTARHRLDEAPAGMMAQGARRIGAKLAGAVGMKGTAAGLTGKADTGKEANQLMVDLKGYLGRTGGNLKQLDAADLSNFLQQKGYPTDNLQNTSGILNTKQVDQAVLGAVQAKAKSGGGGVSTPQSTTQPTARSAVPAQSARAVQPNQQTRQSAPAGSAQGVPSTHQSQPTFNLEDLKKTLTTLTSTELLNIRNELVKKAGTT